MKGSIGENNKIAKSIWMPADAVASEAHQSAFRTHLGGSWDLNVIASN
jgi:hypothetical protein